MSVILAISSLLATFRAEVGVLGRFFNLVPQSHHTLALSDLQQPLPLCDIVVCDNNFSMATCMTYFDPACAVNFATTRTKF